MADNPNIAWKWVERRMREDFGPNLSPPAEQAGPTVIQLRFAPDPGRQLPTAPLALPPPEGDEPA